MQWLQQQFVDYKEAINDLPEIITNTLTANPLEDHKIFYYQAALLANLSHLYTQSYVTLAVSTLMLPYINVPKCNLTLILSVLSHQDYGALEYTPLIFMAAGLCMTFKGGQIKRFVGMLEGLELQDRINLIGTLFKDPASLEESRKEALQKYKK